MKIIRLFVYMVLVPTGCEAERGIPGTYVLIAHGKEQRYTFSDSGTLVVDVEPGRPKQYRAVGDTVFLEVVLPSFDTSATPAPDTMKFVLRGDTLRSVDSYRFFMVRER